MVYTLPSKFDTRKPGPPAVIFVMVGWCGHCKTLKPRLGEFERILRGKVSVYTVDGDASPDRVREFRVDGFPTIVYKTSTGKLYKYEGPREPAALAKFIASVDPGI